MRGSCSPTSMSTIRAPPKDERSITRPACPALARPTGFGAKLHLTCELWQTVAPWSATDGGHALISFKGAQFPKDVILFAAFFYVRYTVSFLDREEIMTRLGVAVDHATLNRLVTI